MKSLTCLKHRVINVLSCLLCVFSVSSIVLAAGPEVGKDKFPDYRPMHTVIKCPYLPPNLRSIPVCGGKIATCVGTPGHDLILGTEENDVIVALAGNDVVHSDAKDDIICGGMGNDSLFGARGDDTIYGGPGDDWLFGAKEADALYGGPGDFDVLWGGPGIDYLHGGPGRFDVCMLQKELGEFDSVGCNTLYPPPGYVHDEEPDAGVLKKAEPLKLN